MESDAKQKVREVWWWVLVAVFLYSFVSYTTYRFRHPEQTETELFSNAFHAYTWGVFSDEA